MMNQSLVMFMGYASNQQIDIDKLILYATPIITLLGWIFTYLSQRTLLEQNRKHEKQDRDLLIFHERLKIINGINSANLVISQCFNQLRILFLSGYFSYDEGLKIIDVLNPNTSKFVELLYDPSFRSLLNLLPKPSEEKIYKYIEEIYSRIQNFNSETVKIDESSRNLQSELKEITLLIDDINPRLVEFSLFLSKEFALIDISLSK